MLLRTQQADFVNRAALRAVLALLALLGCVLATPVQAQIQVSFHSFNGSVIFGRYPHTFVVFEGTLATGEKIYENFGFSAVTAGPGVLSGPVKHEVVAEKEKYIHKTNRHFTIAISDEKYRGMRAEVIKWRDAPGKFYDLNTRNCIHFVGRMAEMLGLKVHFPENMLRKPKAWLNHITRLNPQLGAPEIK